MYVCIHVHVCFAAFITCVIQYSAKCINMKFRENVKMCSPKEIPNLCLKKECRNYYEDFFIVNAICLNLNLVEPKRMSNLLKERMSVYYNGLFILYTICLSLDCSGDVDMTDRPPRKTATAALETKQSNPEEPVQ